MIFGSVINDNLKDEIIVTVIATGFTEEQLIPSRPARSAGFGASRPQTREQVAPPTQQSSPTRERREEAPQFQQQEPAPTTRQQQTNQQEDTLDIPTFLRNRRR